MEKPVKIIYETKFLPSDVMKAYIAVTIDFQYLVHAVNQKSQTLWTGLFDEVQIPSHIADEALDLRGQAFNQVEISRSHPLWGVWLS